MIASGTNADQVEVVDTVDEHFLVDRELAHLGGIDAHRAARRSRRGPIARQAAGQPLSPAAGRVRNSASATAAGQSADQSTESTQRCNLRRACVQCGSALVGPLQQALRERRRRIVLERPSRPAAGHTLAATRVRGDPIDRLVDRIKADAEIVLAVSRHHRQHHAVMPGRY